MRCSTNIVNCLRKKGIEPYAFSSSGSSAAKAIDGIASSIFSSNAENSPQWWAVDFKKLVRINGYKITTDTSTTSGSSIYNWTLSVSVDKINWRVINYPPEGSRNKAISLGNSFISRYARIDGNSLWSHDKTKITIYEIEFYSSYKYTYAIARRKTENIYI